MLYNGERSADVCGGMRSIVSESKAENVNVSGWVGRGVL
jgi:hypothetical protein